MSAKTAYDELQENNRNQLLRNVRASDFIVKVKSYLSPAHIDVINKISTGQDKMKKILRLISMAQLRVVIKQSFKELLHLLPTDDDETPGRTESNTNLKRKGVCRNGDNEYPMEVNKFGRCFIFAFFAAPKYTQVELETHKLTAGDDHALQGYVQDVTALETRFSDMGYRVNKYENLNKTAFESALDETQSCIDKSTDRIVVIVLSHGSENGIYTCEVHANKEMVGKNGHHCEKKEKSTEYITFKYNDIMNHFLHDRVSIMKDLPKFFIFQCCRGQKMVVTAGGSPAPKPSDPSLELPVGINVLTAYSTVEGNVSIVSDCDGGSWFIQNFLRAMDDFPPADHEVETILKRAHKYTSERIADIQTPDHKTKYGVRQYRQMSLHQSTLTKQFYLSV